MTDQIIRNEIWDTMQTPWVTVYVEWRSGRMALVLVSFV